VGKASGSHVAVIGAGVIGLSVAYNLASRGAESVSVFERLRIAAEASGVQPGGVRQQWGTEINCSMGREALEFYRDVQVHLDARVDPGFRSCGYVFLAESAAMLDTLRANVELQNSLGVPSEILSSDQIADVIPDFNGDSILGAGFCQEDGYFDRPQSVVEAFADAATRLGVSIEYTEVVGLRRQGSSWFIDKADGSGSSADHVVVAAGYDSPNLLQSLGVKLPITKEPRYLFYSPPISERLLEPLVISAERQFATKQLGDGRMLASDLAATGQPEDEIEIWKTRIKANSNQLLPRLEFVPLSILVEGFYDMTPDGQAVIGPVDGYDGLWIAAGFSGHGFMMAPVVGDRLATAVLDGVLEKELDTLSLARFGEERLLPDPQVF